jgi:hypothetical protein
MVNTITAPVTQPVDRGIDTATGAVGAGLNSDLVKMLLRAGILGAGGAALGGLGGSMLRGNGITYDKYGNPKRKSRAGWGALLGGGLGAGMGLLARQRQE